MKFQKNYETNFSTNVKKYSENLTSTQNVKNLYEEFVKNLSLASHLGDYSEGSLDSTSYLEKMPPKTFQEINYSFVSATNYK